MIPGLKSIATGNKVLHANWSDGTINAYPYIWLRDNDIADLHPTTRERMFDLTSVSIDIEPMKIELVNGAVEILWPERRQASSYASDWLYRHRPGCKRDDPADINQVLWTAESLQEIPRFHAENCLTKPTLLREALSTAKSTGLVLFDGLADDADAGVNFGDCIGFKRQTNFGVTFDVVSKPEPNNLAYTAAALPLHIDLTNQELVPGYQFLHCVQNSATGGESVFGDGYSACAELQKTAPEHFACLKETPIPCRFHDDDFDIRQHRPVISQDSSGEFTQLVFNAHIADIPDMPASVLQDFYAAYQALMRIARGDKYRLQYVLQPGEMVMFDNRRVMHGRGEFDPTSGARHLRGYYIDRNEVDSRLRVLQRQIRK